MACELFGVQLQTANGKKNYYSESKAFHVPNMIYSAFYYYSVHVYSYYATMLFCYYLCYKKTSVKLKSNLKLISLSLLYDKSFFVLANQQMVRGHTAG